MVRGNKFKPAPAAPASTLPVAEPYTAGAPPYGVQTEPRDGGQAVSQPEPGSGSLRPAGQAGRSCNDGATGRSAGSAMPWRPGPAKAPGHPRPAGGGDCSAKRNRTEAAGAILAGDACGARSNILTVRTAAEEPCAKRGKATHGLAAVAGADAGREAAAEAFSAPGPRQKQHKGWTAGAVSTGVAIAGPPKAQRHAEREGAPERLESAAVAVHTTVQAPGVHGAPGMTLLLTCPVACTLRASSSG